MALEPIDSRKQIKKVLNNAEIFKENGYATCKNSSDNQEI